MAIQKQANIVFKPGKHNVLIVSVAREDDLIRIDIVLRCLRDALGLGKPGTERGNYDNAEGTQNRRSCHLVGEDERAP